MKLIKIFLLLIIKIKFVYNFEYCPFYNPQCSCTSNDLLKCDNFTTLNELYFFKKLKLSNLKLTPKSEKFRLDDNLNIDNLELDEYNFELRLANLNGIDLDENPFYNKTNKINKQYLYLHLSNSTLNLFYRKNSFEWICDLVVNDNNLFPIFASFKHLFIGYFHRVEFNSKICPVMFKNAKIDWLYLSFISPNNQFSFIHVNSNNLNSQIKYLQIQSSSLDCLDERILEKNVFKNLEKISIEFSNLYKIEKNLFKSFKYLRRVNLWLYNLKEFLHNDMSWLQNLNLKSPKQFYLELSDESNEYTYPDEDLCLFEQFPHTHKVFPIIRSQLDLNCSCTLLWLLSNWNKSEKDIRTRSILDCLKDFQMKLNKCNLKERLISCTRTKKNLKLHIHNSSSSTSSYLFYLLFFLSLLKQFMQPSG